MYCVLFSYSYCSNFLDVDSGSERFVDSLKTTQLTVYLLGDEDTSLDPWEQLTLDPEQTDVREMVALGSSACWGQGVRS